MKLLSNRIDRHVIVCIYKNSSQYVRRGSCPVLKGAFYEIRYWHDQASKIPDPDNDVSKRYLFDAAPLVFDYYDIVNSDRLGDSYLKACDKR